MDALEARVARAQRLMCDTLASLTQTDFDKRTELDMKGIEKESAIASPSVTTLRTMLGVALYMHRLQKCDARIKSVAMHGESKIRQKCALKAFAVHAIGAHG